MMEILEEGLHYVGRDGTCNVLSVRNGDNSSNIGTEPISVASVAANVWCTSWCSGHVPVIDTVTCQTHTFTNTAAAGTKTVTDTSFAVVPGVDPSAGGRECEHDEHTFDAPCLAIGFCAWW